MEVVVLCECVQAKWGISCLVCVYMCCHVCLCAQALNGAKLGEAKLVDIPGVDLNLPFLGAHDKEYLAFCGQNSGGPGQYEGAVLS